MAVRLKTPKPIDMPDTSKIEDPILREVVDNMKKAVEALHKDVYDDLVQMGGTAGLGGTTPAAIGTPAEGSATKGAKADHVHGPGIAAPTGIISMWSTASAPTGWSLCDGSAISRTTFAALFAVIGTTFGAGDGSTTFNVPDLRGRAPIGAGQGSGLTNRTLAGTVGSETHTLTSSEMPSHTHTGPSHVHSGPSHSHSTPAHSHVISTGAGSGSWPAGFAQSTSPITSGLGNTSTTTSTGNNPGTGDGSGTSGLEGTGDTGSGGTGATGSSGSDGAHNNMQPSLVVNFIIKT